MGFVQRAELYYATPSGLSLLQLSQDMNPVYEGYLVLRIITGDAIEGLGGNTLYTEGRYDYSVAEAVSLLLPQIIGLPIETQSLAYIHNRLLNQYGNCTPQAQSIVDIALWDLLAKQNNCTVARLLSLSIENIPSTFRSPFYFSLPYFSENERCCQKIIELMEERETSCFKLHLHGSIEHDIKFMGVLQRNFNGSDVHLILDAEEKYTEPEVRRLIDTLNPNLIVWLEAPVDDYDLNAYKRLRSYTEIPILPAGNKILDPNLIRFGVEMGAWDAVRVDITKCGGFSSLRKIYSIACQNQVRIELQSWGYGLTQAANLHAQIGLQCGQYFEYSFPEEKYHLAFHNPFKTKEGFIYLNDRLSGLGVSLDWNSLKKVSTICRFFK